MKTTANDLHLTLDDLDVLKDCLDLTVANLDINDKNPELLDKAQQVYVKIWNIYGLKCLQKTFKEETMNKRRNIKEDIMWELAYISTKIEDLLDTDLYSVTEDIKRLRDRFDIVVKRINEDLVGKE